MIASKRSLSPSPEAFKAQVLLHELEIEIDSKAEQQNALGRLIIDQMEQASARPLACSQLGAILYTNNDVERIRNERERISSTLSILETHACEINSQLKMARRRSMDMMKKTGSDSALDVSVYGGYYNKVEKVLSTLSTNHGRSYDDDDFEDEAEFF